MAGMARCMILKRGERQGSQRGAAAVEAAHTPRRIHKGDGHIRKSFTANERECQVGPLLHDAFMHTEPH